jgi:hypothetical protein
MAQIRVWFWNHRHTQLLLKIYLLTDPRSIGTTLKSMSNRMPTLWFFRVRVSLSKTFTYHNDRNPVSPELPFVTESTNRYTYKPFKTRNFISTEKSKVKIYIHKYIFKGIYILTFFQRIIQINIISWLYWFSLTKNLIMKKIFRY